MQSLQQIASCVTGYDPNALPVVKASEFIARLVPRVQAVESLAIRSALGRVLARDLVSGIDVPSHDNSAMDGYALRSVDLLGAADTLIEVAGTAYAGTPFGDTVPIGQGVRIMTGAVMPDGLDTVVPQEFTRAEADGRIRIPQGSVKPGDNRRLRGEDLARGEAALKAGRILTPADLGLLASLGQAEVAVYRRLRVAFFSTGDELRSIGEPLEAGCVYDSKQIMAELGEVLFWKIAMRPGRPMAIGRIGSANSASTPGVGEPGHQAILFGLPGNPVAVMVTFYAFVREALLAMSGATPQPLAPLRAVSQAALRKKPGRTEYQRGIVSQAEDGRWQVRITGSQGSGILRSMSQANGMVVLHHDQGDVAAGDLVDVIAFDGLV